MNSPYLLLWLEAPLQSWGYDSRFGRRSSLDFPTRSGVLGLLCCARGAGGPETDWLQRWVDLDMRLVAYTRKGRTGAGQRVAQTHLCDFHMVGSGYDDSDPWQKLLIPKKSDGLGAVGGGTKMTYRYYLQDMAFAVALQVPAGMAGELADALLAPVWDLYLGRKCCVPVEYIYQGTFETAGQALEAGEALAMAKDRRAMFRVVHGEQEDGEVITLNDVPVRFGDHKLYRDRQVTRFSCD